MAKLILYQAKSPYPGDITKNCALTGKEVDNNFLNLKGEDIEKIYLDEETKKLTFTRFKDGLRNCNGEPIKAEIEVDLTELEYVIGYRYEDGVIKVAYSNGKTAEMPIEAFGMAVATDSTISGNGSKSNPLSISQAMRTGQYQSVKDLIDIADGENLPKDNLVNGDGYVTWEIKSKFGLFYTSDQALKLQEILMLESSEWRVPTKKDWDTLLNYLEDCDKYKNHALRSQDDVDARGMKLGNLAGFKAKSINVPDADYWGCGASNGDVLRIYPTGSFSALSGAYDGFGDYAQFWTLTEGDMSCRNFYSKKFIDCVGTVTQIEEMPAAKLSIRLVKDFLGDNYNQFEDIHGRMYETKLFASEGSECNQVWTMVNIDIQDPERDLLATPIPESATSAITTEYAYYINRWDGRKWDKHEMTEGDCVVILDPNVCGGMSEYRLECGELVDYEGRIWEQIDELASAITETTETLQSEIDEISAATQETRADVDELSGKTAALEEIVGEGLSGTTLTDAIIQLQEEKDDKIWESIGKPSDIPEKTASEYTDEDFLDGRITVFGYINASNDYGYNLDTE